MNLWSVTNWDHGNKKLLGSNALNWQLSVLHQHPFLKLNKVTNCIYLAYFNLSLSVRTTLDFLCILGIELSSTSSFLCLGALVVNLFLSLPQSCTSLAFAVCLFTPSVVMWLSGKGETFSCVSCQTGWIRRIDRTGRPGVPSLWLRLTQWVTFFCLTDATTGLNTKYTFPNHRLIAIVKKYLTTEKIVF